MAVRLEMQKEVTQKEDGRYLIYYHFTEEESVTEVGGQQMGSEFACPDEAKSGEGGITEKCGHSSINDEKRQGILKEKDMESRVTNEFDEKMVGGEKCQKSSEENNYGGCTKEHRQMILREMNSQTKAVSEDLTPKVVNKGGERHV